MPQGIFAILRQEVMAAMLWQCIEAFWLGAKRTVDCSNDPLRQYPNVLWQWLHCGNIAAMGSLLQYCDNAPAIVVLQQHCSK